VIHLTPPRLAEVDSCAQLRAARFQHEFLMFARLPTVHTRSPPPNRGRSFLLRDEGFFSGTSFSL